MDASMNKQPILFLDIDGPLVTDGSGGKEQDHPDTAVFKPEAVHFVNELVRISGATIVVISDWAGRCMFPDEQYDTSFVPKTLIRAFSRNGLVNDQFHPLWSHLCLVRHPDVHKHEITDAHRNMRGYRPAYWLKTQGDHSHYAILDDAPCYHDEVLFNRPTPDYDLEPPTNPGYVRVNSNIGITRLDFDKALNLLTEGVEMART